jgi:hypothetical protein
MSHYMGIKKFCLSCIIHVHFLKSDLRFYQKICLSVMKRHYSCFSCIYYKIDPVELLFLSDPTSLSLTNTLISSVNVTKFAS